MRNILSDIRSLWKIWWKNLWFAQKSADILSDWFDISKVDQIGETELRQIFSYQFNKNSTKSFFVVYSKESKEKWKFQAEDIDTSVGSDWFILVAPSQTSHIITPKRGWIKFNWSNVIVLAMNRSNPWGYNGGTFQLDKNIWVPLIYSQIPLEKMLELGQQYISQSLKK